MTIPDDLPDIPTSLGVQPSLGDEKPLGDDGIKVFKIGLGLTTHFDRVTCDMVGCADHLYGFKVSCNSDTDLGQRQISFIKGSGRTYTSWWEEDGTVNFIFNQGQSHFLDHWRRNATGPDMLVVDGIGGPPTTLAPAVWVRSFTEHMRSLQELQQITGAVRRVPTWSRNESGGSLELGYGLHVGGLVVSETLTSLRIAVPLSTSDSTRPVSVSRLVDFQMSMTGVRNRGTPLGSVHHRLSQMEGTEQEVSIQVGQWFMPMQAKVTGFSLYRPLAGAVGWRIVGRLSTTESVGG